MLIPIKPLSVNRCWQGKRFKTKDYLAYEQELFYKLPQMTVYDKKQISLVLDVGMSSNSDIDNIAKPFIDILQKKYGFNDRYIEQIHLFKNVVKKGKEFINFEINYLDD